MSVHFGSAFYFQGTQRLVAEYERRCEIFAGKSEGAEERAAEHSRLTRGRVIFLIGQDIAACIPGLSQLTGFGRIIVGARLLISDTCDWRLAGVGLITRGALEILNFEPLLMCGDILISFHKSRKISPETA